MTILVEHAVDALRRHADRTAVSDPTVTLDYRALAEQSAAAAGLLARHDRADPPLRVGILAANSVGYVVCYLAILRRGGVPFLIDAASGPNELAVIAADCSLDLLVHDDRDLGDLAATPVGTLAGLNLTALPDTPVRYELLSGTEVCRFTSGSTGKPNCIEFSGRAVYKAAANWAAGTGLGPDDRIACFAALSNGLAFNTSLLSAILAGASLHLSAGLPTAGHVERVLRRCAGTRLVAFPALYQSVLRRGLDPEVAAGVRIAISSGAPLHPDTRAAFQDLVGIPICNYYGVAETGPLTFTTAPDATSLGAPLPEVSLRAGDAAPAQIRVVSASMASRYLNAPGVFEDRRDPDGYVRTGDEGYLRDGELVLTGRTGRYINVGGRKVDPIEVAEVLRRATGVRDAVAFAATNRHGETVVAAAVAADPTLTATTLRRHCLAGLAEYKVPTQIHVLAEIPANSIGKPSLAALRRLSEGDPGGR